MEENKNRTSAGKLGILTTFQQDWGITRYVSRFLNNFASDQVVLLAEDVSRHSLLASDPENVRRVWKRTSTDYSELEATIREEQVKVLHVNCCFPFLDSTSFSALIERLRRAGVVITAHIHDSNAREVLRNFLSTQCDLVITDNRRELLAAVSDGVPADKIMVVESGINASGTRQEQNVRKLLGIDADQTVVVCCDFGLPEARIEEIIAATYQLQRRHPSLHLYVLQVDTNSGFESGYGEILKRKVESLHLDNYVHFIQDDAARSLLPKFMSAANTVVLSAGRPQFEAREVLTIALECATPIVGLSDQAFDGLEGAIYRVGPRLSIEQAIDNVLSNAALQNVMREGAREFGAKRTTERAVTSFAEAIEALSGLTLELDTSKQAVEHTAAVEQRDRQSPAIISNKLRILMLNRGNALTHRGGDTVVMERVSEGLRALGHHVDIDVNQEKNPRDYDLAHLYNFAIREATEQMARRCYEAKTPYVVTTMYEDWPVFYNQMANLYFALKAYVEVGQPGDKWQMLLKAAKAVEPAPAWDNTWTAHHSAALIATGEYEAESLRRDYPQTPRVEIYRCGHEVTEFRDNGDLFRKETGLSDFVLCVGRLEWRKNQLMLLKALEESDLPVVFATGGFTYQPEYEQVCRAFRRKGKTVYLGRISPELLASAFAAARVHVLPSWYELPGLVSLEAAQHETNVVVTDYGTARDYLGNKAYYCEPDDDESILNAVTAAFYAPTKQGLAEQVAEFTWENATKRNNEIYRMVLDGAALALEDSPVAEATRNSIREADRETRSAGESVARIPEVVGAPAIPAHQLEAAEACCARGDDAMRRHAPEEARQAYEDALEVAPGFARAVRSLGVLLLTAEDYSEAEKYFRNALKADPRDTKSLLGLGAVCWAQNEKSEAFDLYLRAAENDPGNASTMLYLVNAAYELDKLVELEGALRRFLKVEKNNLHIQYCLAGCYFRLEKYARAEGVIERILQLQPDHEDALELREEIRKLRSPAEPNSAEVVSQTSQQSTVSTVLHDIEELKRQKNYEAVISKADEFLAAEQGSNSDQALARILRAEALASLGKTIEADGEFAKATADAAFAYRALTGRGAIAASFEHWEQAESLFRSALASKPDYDPAVTGLGITAMNRGEEEEAWQHFQHALSINSESLQALLGVVQLGYSLNRLQAMERALIDYLELHPVDFSMVFSYAGCLYAQNRMDEAAEQCRKILLFEPEHQSANELLAKIESRTESQVSIGNS